MKLLQWPRIILVTGACLGAFFSMTTSAPAEELIFDLEDQAPTCGSKNRGMLSTLTLQQNGVSVQLARPGSLFDLCDNQAFGPDYQKPGSFGRVSLSSFFDDKSSTPLIVDISVPVAAFGLDIGDFAQDTDTLEIEAFSAPGATGQSLGRATAILANNNDDKFGFKRLEIKAAEIRSVRVLAGSARHPHSMFYDNLSLETTSSIRE